MTTLKDQVQSALSALGTFASGHETITADDGALRLECDLSALETLGCQFDRLAVRTDSLDGADSDRLRAVAEDLSSRITYLLEPISPIEIDQHGCVVQMRSNPPQKSDDGSCYYELLVERGGQLSLCRYQKTPGQPRQPIPAQTTREVLLRLVEDFEAVL